jgi:hypothetical protein
MTADELRQLIFIVEIVLSILVLIRGWKWKAIIPMSTGYIFKFFFYYADMEIPGVYIDIVVYIILIRMLFIKPR